MEENKHFNFAQNLRRIRKERDLTMVEFSQTLDVPKSTLQTILMDGNTTLATAIRISDRLEMPLDVLLSSEPLAQEFQLARWILRSSGLFLSLTPDQQDRVVALVQELMEALRT